MGEEIGNEAEEKESPRRKKGILRIVLKTILYGIMILFLLNATLYIALSIPYVQNKLIAFASDKLSEMLKTDVRVSHVRFNLFNDLELRDLYVADQASDTLLYTQKLQVGIRPISYILDRCIRITEVELTDLVVNVTAPSIDSTYNFQFIVDEFSSSETTSVDTTKSPMPKIIVDDVSVNNGRLVYRIMDVEETPGIFNASDIQVSELNLNISAYSIDPEKLDVHVNSISMKDKCGFELSNLEGHLTSEGSLFNFDQFELRLPNSHLKTKSLFYNLQSQSYELITDEVEIYPLDLVAFYPPLQVMKDKLTLRTSIKGQLPSINLEEIFLSYGKEAELAGNASISTYVQLDKTDIEVNISRLYATPVGIESLAKLGDETFVKPEILDSLGALSFNGQLKGKFRNFDLKSNLSAKSGAVNLDAKGSIDTTFTNFDIQAQLKTINFDLEALVGKDRGIGDLSMHINLEAHQKGVGTFNTKIKGAIDSLELVHGKVIDLPFAGSYNPQRIGFAIDAKLHFGRIMAGFEMITTKKPDINFGLRLQNIDLSHFYANKYWVKPDLDFDVKGKIRQFDIDDLNADITIKDLKFQDEDFLYTPEPIVFKAWKDSITGTKHITLNSSIVSANLEGDYKFSTLSDEFAEVMNKSMPDVFPMNKKRKEECENDFKFDFKAYNSEELGYIFNFGADIVDPLIIKGEVDTRDHIIKVEGQLPLLQTYSSKVKNTTLNIVSIDSTFNIKMDTKYEQGTYGYNFSLNIDGADNVINSFLMIDSDDAVGAPIHGDLNLKAEFDLDDKGKLVSQLEVLPTNMMIGTFVMNMLPAKLINSDGRTQVQNFGIGINGKEYMDINGYISSNKEDSLFIDFQEAQLGEILQGLNIDYVHALIDGNIVGTSLLSTPKLFTNGFQISDITLYKDTLGTIVVNSMWDPEKRGVLLHADVMQNGKMVMDLKGITQPDTKKVDMSLEVDRFSIAWLKPFAEGLLSDISGDVSSKLEIGGTYDALQTEGFFGFNNAKVGVEYTNVDYYISDTINIGSNIIGFQNLILKDSEGNKGVINAKVTHKNFQDMEYSLDLKADNLMVLNTQNRTDSLFYGKLYTSGTVKIKGNDKGIDLDLQVKNGKKSALNVTIPQTVEAAQYKSVVYINVPETKEEKEKDRWRREQRAAKEESSIPIKIKMKLTVDSNLGLAVIIDPSTGDRMDVKGSGTIDFTYDMSNDNMTVFGDYNIKDGGVKLNIANLSKMEFKIREGSRLRLIGDPMKTKFDIVAYRRVRADLRTLDANSFEGDNTSPRVQVDCLLGIVGDMNKMDLTYDIELVNGTDDQARKVKSLVNTNEMRIKQFAYLIASGTFYSNTSSSGANFGDGMWTSIASSALSSGLNAVFGSMLGNNWELGADLKDGDTSVSASTKLFDDKLRIETNLGHRSDTYSNASGSTSSFIGDFDIEYTLNTTWMLKAYSHTNDSYARQAPTTQGVGIVFTREGPTFKRLFKSFRRKRPAWAVRESDSIRAKKDSIRVVQDSIAAKEKSIQQDISRHSSDSIKSTVLFIPKSQGLPKEEDIASTMIKQPTLISKRED